MMLVTLLQAASAGLIQVCLKYDTWVPNAPSVKGTKIRCYDQDSGYDDDMTGVHTVTDDAPQACVNIKYRDINPYWTYGCAWDCYGRRRSVADGEEHLPATESDVSASSASKDPKFAKLAASLGLETHAAPGARRRPASWGPQNPDIYCEVDKKGFHHVQTHVLRNWDQKKMARFNVVLHPKRTPGSHYFKAGIFDKDAKNGFLCKTQNPTNGHGLHAKDWAEICQNHQRCWSMCNTFYMGYYKCNEEMMRLFKSQCSKTYNSWDWQYGKCVETAHDLYNKMVMRQQFNGGQKHYFIDAGMAYHRAQKKCLTKEELTSIPKI